MTARKAFFDVNCPGQEVICYFVTSLINRVWEYANDCIITYLQIITKYRLRIKDTTSLVSPVTSSISGVISGHIFGLNPGAYFG